MKLNNIKKGAMFGLDARIALAIFGALSVISGAALYSAIQNAKTEQYRQFFLEMEKAALAYYLDTGEDVPQHSGGTYAISSVLVDNVYSNPLWKGPYIDGEVYNTSHIKNNFTKKYISDDAYFNIKLNKNISGYCVVGDKDCFSFFGISYRGDKADENTDKGFTSIQEIFDTLDKDIDDSDGWLGGKVRIYSAGSGSSFTKSVYYKVDIPRVLK